MDKLFFGLSEFAQKMGVSSKTVYRMLNDNQIPFAVKIGGQWRFRIDAVDNWLASRVNASNDDITSDSSMTLAKALANGAVLYRIIGDNRDEILDDILSTLPVGSVDGTGIKISVLAKEALASSSLKGVARMLPSHERPVFVEKSMVFLAFLEKPTNFKALDGEKAEVVFLILAANPLEENIINTRLTRLLMEPAFLRDLKRQPARKEGLQMILDFEQRLLPSRQKGDRKLSPEAIASFTASPSS